MEHSASFQRRRLISSLQNSESNHDESLAQLRDYKSPKAILIETPTVSVAKKKPTFVLPNRNTTTDKQKYNKEILTRTEAPSKLTVPKFQLSTPRSSVDHAAVITPSNTGTVTSSNTSSAFLGSFNANSVEARLYHTMNPNRSFDFMPNTGVSNNGIDSDTIRIEEERALRERQDSELLLSVMQDHLKSTQEEEKRIAEQRVQERRKYLTENLLPEPSLNSEDRVVTLSFRFRNTMDTTSMKMLRKQRRFLVTSPVAQLLLYVESLHVSFLSSTAVVSQPGIELSLDFPTRTISWTEGSTECSLQEKGITTDSVVWVKILDAQSSNG